MRQPLAARPRSLPWILLALAWGSGGAASASPAPQAEDWERLVNGGPGPSVPDQFHPDRDVEVEPRRGGRVIVHHASKPKNLNYMVENSATTRRILREVHAFLMERDWETWEWQPVLAESYDVEDTVVLKGGRDGMHGNVVWGRVTEDDKGYLVTPVSEANPLAEPRRLAPDEVERVARRTVYTFRLREGVRWHDGKTLDSGDVLFSYLQYLNPNVDCDQVRFKFQKFVGAEALDALTVRFFLKQPYFLTEQTFDDLTILPSHVYNLRDPENPSYDADATDSEQGTFLNENPANTAWIGLGPYRITGFDSQAADAVRFDEFFDPENGGWVDSIRWRFIASDDTTKQAVANGEIDYWDRLRPEDYYGEFCKTPSFTSRYYKGLKSYAYTGYIAWNMRRPKFADPNVRKALNHCFPYDEYIKTMQFGLASQVTGTTYYFSPNYNRSIEPISYDLEAAEDLLLEAGWYDRDGDDIIDKDGVPFTIEFLMPTGNKASENIAVELQSQLAKIGVKLNIVTREWATFLEALYDREFECANLAWISEVVSDPEQIWHSKWVEGRSSNHCGLADDEVDRLIEELQVELDPERQQELFFALQERIYELQPYMFLFNKPVKIVVSKRLRNFRTYAPDPGYRIRDWFIVEEEDAKEAREASAATD